MWIDETADWPDGWTLRLTVHGNLVDHAPIYANPPIDLLPSLYATAMALLEHAP